VEGSAVLAVRVGVAAAVARARAGDGASLVESRALRLRGHSEADAHDYVPKAELEAGRATEPLARFDASLRAWGLLDEPGHEALVGRITAALDAALDRALALPPPDGSEAGWGRYSEEGHPSRGRGIPGVPGLAASAFDHLARKGSA
jgi:pyruvate dehydrogenase E1 component alpha subunit